MATLYSTQITNAAAKPPVMNSNANTKLRRLFFDWTGDAAQNDSVQLVVVPADARIIGGEVTCTAFGALVTLDIGDGTTENKYLSAGDVSAIANISFANTVALSGRGSEVTSASFTLTAKLEGANPASGTLRGWIDVMVD